MRDIKAISEAYNQIDHTQYGVALATVVNVDGSSYRRPGARMMIVENGRWVGSISGGCLEGDALRKARAVMSDGKAVTVTYDTREESNQQLGIALGCNGVIEVLIEPVIYGSPDNPILLFRQFIETETPLVLATIFKSGTHMADKCLMDSHYNLLRSFKDVDLTLSTAADLEQALKNKKSGVGSYLRMGDSAEIFIEVIHPSISLLIFGAGVDARPVTALAKSLGWNVTVTDECVAHIAPIFFPQADKLSLCQRDFVDRDFRITPYTACVMMSHNYDYDRDVLRKIIHTDTPYIGIMGPRKRFDKMLRELEQDNFHIPQDEIQKVYAPIGLDIGAEAADEIAVSIIAEIQARFSGLRGGFLKDRDGDIHSRQRATFHHAQEEIS